MKLFRLWKVIDGTHNEYVFRKAHITLTLRDILHRAYNRKVQVDTKSVGLIQWLKGEW